MPQFCREILYPKASYAEPACRNLINAAIRDIFTPLPPVMPILGHVLPGHSCPPPHSNYSAGTLEDGVFDQFSDRSLPGAIPLDGAAAGAFQGVDLNHASI